MPSLRCICPTAPTTDAAKAPIDTDETLLRIYREELFPSFPFVPIPDGTSARQLHATRPFLMSCIRMAASFRSPVSMQSQMVALRALVVERLLVRAERSVELLAGIVVMLGWHHYHCVVHAQMHNLIALAANLAAELGLKRAAPGWQWQQGRSVRVGNSGPRVRERTGEEKRLLLGIWYISSSYVFVFIPTWGF